MGAVVVWHSEGEHVAVPVVVCLLWGIMPGNAVGRIRRKVKSISFVNLETI